MKPNTLQWLGAALGILGFVALWLLLHVWVAVAVFLMIAGNNLEQRAHELRRLERALQRKRELAELDGEGGC